MKPFDDLKLPMGSKTLKAKLPPYPLLELALNHPATHSGMPYCMVSMEGERFVRQDGFTPETEVGADLLFLLLDGEKKVFLSSKGKSLLFDLQESKVYLLKTEKAAAFIKRSFEERRYKSPSVAVLLARHNKVKSVGQKTFDEQPEDEKIRLLVQDWYAIEADRKERREAILKGDTPGEAYRKQYASTISSIQKMKIVLRDLVEKDAAGKVGNDFFRDLYGLKAEIALLEAYADVEIDCYF